MVFHEVCADLENIGYEVQAFIIPASGINAPHQRERLWITAKNTLYNGCLFREFKQERAKDGKFGNIGTRDTNGIYLSERFTTNFDNTRTNSNLHGFYKRNGNNEINASKRGFNALNDIDQSNGIGNATDTESQRTREQSSENRGREDGRFNDLSEDGNAPDTDSIRLERECGPIGELGGEIRFSSTSSRNMWDTAWDNFPTESPVCGGDDGISHGLDNITFSKWRNESIKGYGNAVVPQVVYRIFKTIEYIQNLKQ
jgi:DNA (cytosine-5)-methyltransferase 1